ncbi:hypothetical protein [Parapedobacter tibetensis]|uniref:hypothetical protein n=1 Tax=Parapedobacter tibetensis TaxID=2972951 RepID=UPI00214D9D4E|nr:hypothetical protein [Parapedobacter tibetensis]
MSKIKINNDQIIGYLNKRQQELTHELGQVGQALAALSTLGERHGPKALKHLAKAEKSIRKSNKVNAAKEKEKAKKLAATARRKTGKSIKKAVSATKRDETETNKPALANALSSSEVSPTPVKASRGGSRPSTPKQAANEKTALTKTNPEADTVIAPKG